MSEWKEWIDETGLTWWLHEEHGNIVKTSDGKYIAIVPKTYKLGPYTALDEAKKASESKDIDNMINDYNNSRIVK